MSTQPAEEMVMADGGLRPVREMLLAAPSPITPGQHQQRQQQQVLQQQQLEQQRLEQLQRQQQLQLQQEHQLQLQQLQLQQQQEQQQEQQQQEQQQQEQQRQQERQRQRQEQERQERQEQQLHIQQTQQPLQQPQQPLPQPQQPLQQPQQPLQQPQQPLQQPQQPLQQPQQPLQQPQQPLQPQHQILQPPPQLLQQQHPHNQLPQLQLQHIHQLQQSPYSLYPNSPAESPSSVGQSPTKQTREARLVPARPLVPETRRWRVTKVALHLFCIVCCIVGLAVGFIVLSGTWFGFLAAVLTCSLCGPAIVWSLAETITLWVRKWHHGMHPGAHVAVSLLICLTAMGFGVGIGSMGSQLAHIEEAVAAANATGSTSLGDSAQWLEQWQDQQPGPGSSTPIPGRLFGLSAVLVSISLVHLFLFVRACVDTHRRNKAGSVMVVSYEGGASATGAPPPAFQHDGQRFRSHAVAPTASGEAELNGEHSESTWQDKAHEFPGDEHFVAAELFTPPEPRTKC